MTRTVIMCGGPADGRWMVVPDDKRVWEVATLPQVPVMAVTREETLDVPMPRYTTYRIHEEDLFGRSIWVGVPVDDHRYDWSLTVMRTVLQRDVAQHLGAYR